MAAIAGDDIAAAEITSKVPSAQSAADAKSLDGESGNCPRARRVAMT